MGNTIPSRTLSSSPKDTHEHYAATQLAPRVKVGYSAIYLTQINKRGVVVSVWKIHFEDEGDEMIANLSLKHGKIRGFFLI